MHDLELPSVLMDQRSLNMMTTLLFYTSQKKKKGVYEKIEDSMKDVRLTCHEVFQENNVKKRTAFFSEPLIKYLWTLFIVYKPEIII